MRAITLTAAVLLAGGAAVRAQTPAASVAVLPFEDGGSYGQDDDTYAGLQVALPVLIGARLRGSAGVRMVGDDTARAVLAAQDLGEHHRVDALTAVRIGRALRARYVVLGTFLDYFGRFRLDTRIVDVASGRILAEVSNDDPAHQDRRDLGVIVGLVADGILRTVGLPPAPAPPPAPIPASAIGEFGRGLLLSQRADTAGAVRALQRALQADPDFPEARAALQRIQRP